MKKIRLLNILSVVVIATVLCGSLALTMPTTAAPDEQVTYYLHFLGQVSFALGPGGNTYRYSSSGLAVPAGITTAGWVTVSNGTITCPTYPTNPCDDVVDDTGAGLSTSISGATGTNQFANELYTTPPTGWPITISNDVACYADNGSTCTGLGYSPGDTLQCFIGGASCETAYSGSAGTVYAGWHNFHGRTFSGTIDVYYIDTDPEGAGQLTTYEFNANADNWLNSDQPGTNYGSAVYFGAGDACLIFPLGDCSSTGIIRFNIDLIPASAEVISATLRLYTTGDSYGSGNRTFDAFLLKSEWNESESNWDDRLIEFDEGLQLLVSRPWATAGAGALERVLPSTSSASVPFTGDSLVEFDVSEDVRKIVTAQQINHGWVLEDRTLADGFMRFFHSSESLTDAFRPVLEIEFLPHDDAVDANWLQDGSFEEGSPEWTYNSGVSNRISNLSPSSLNVGPAACGDFYSVIDGGYNVGLNRFEALSQRFYWPGGTAFFHAYVRRHTLTGIANLVIALNRIDGTTPPGAIYSSFLLGGLEWVPVNTTLAGLEVGWYDLEIGDGYNSADGEPSFDIDDITIALNQTMTYCQGLGGPTRTPFPSPSGTPSATASPTRTAGPSPTRTNTPGVSPTPTGTSTSAPATNFSNCNFEAGSSGWSGTGWTLGLAGGPIGPQHAIITGTAYQSFNWSQSGVVYVSYWIGPGSYGAVRLRHLATGQVVTLQTIAGSANQWTLTTRTATLGPTGTWRIEFSGQSPTAPIRVDGVMVARYGFSYCGSPGGPITPTSGPTSFVSPTASNTANATWTVTPSRTPSRTPAPAPSNTSAPSSTPVPSLTMPPTNTQIPTNTQLAAEQTSTAQGTTVPTYTPYPTFTPLPTYTPYATPPPQPPPAPGAPCVAPASGDVASWMEYGRCQSLSFVSWSPTNTAQILAMSTQAAGHEPFSTINQTGQFVADVQSLIGSADWNSTGASCSSALPDPVAIMRSAQGILTGNFAWGTGEYTLDENCNLPASAIVGPFITRALCIMLNLLCATGLLTWFQWLSNAIVVFMFAIYMKKNWIDSGVM